MCEYIKYHICKRLSAALPVFLCMAYVVIFSFPSFAAEAVIAAATIPVSVTVSNGEGTAESGISAEKYTFRLTALNNAPMPGNDTVIICGSGNAEFSIDYENIGVYHYTVTQDCPAVSGETDAGQDTESYDDTIYYVTVTVQKIEGGEIGVIVAAHRGNNEGDKCEIRFENTLRSETGETEGATEAATETSTEDETEPYLPSGYMAYDPLEETTESESESEFYTETYTETYEEYYETETEEESCESELSEMNSSVTESSDESTGSTELSASDSPQTGDGTPLRLLGILMIASLWLEFMAVFTRKRKIHR